ncbi:hypothetical protein C5167_039722 [Papaver somniferum]|uniref:Uncharacterized protein n=1 Tax=Papaver somniferum TaxID=3469 RepID=A0A4Y7ICX7_PAPSO|nr:hypothetical protein C5167_039722 [Papaver somniferum]
MIDSVACGGCCVVFVAVIPRRRAPSGFRLDDNDTLNSCEHVNAKGTTLVR